MSLTNWKFKSLGELVDFASGGTPSKANPNYWNGDIPWISAVTMHDQDVFDSPLKITKEACRSGSKLAQKDDLLLLVRGSMLWKKIPICICKRDVAFNQDVKSIKTKGEITSTFLMYWFLAHQQFLLNRVVGTGIGAGKLDFDEIKALDIHLPPLPEQKAIADLLSTWDSAIEKTERLIAAKEKRFQWLLDELINQNPDKANWKAHAFNSIFKQQRNKHTGEGQCEILSVTKDGIVLQSEYFNKEIASEDLTGYLIVDRDEFVMSGLNFWMGSVDFQTIVDRGLVSPAYKVYKVVSKSIDMDFLKIFVRSTSMTNLLVSVSVQGASIVRRNLDKEMLENSVIKAPSLSKQKEIAGIIISAQKEIDLLKTLAKKYKQQKRGLMQKLLTGEWRVKVA